MLRNLLVAWTLAFVPVGVVEAASEVSAAVASRKTVTVFADNAAEAIAKAEKKYPGWKAIEVRKIGGGRIWRVTMIPKQ
ncbi:MAG: hypothetical protein KatS3mg105_3569 [Gemmatales bacterium]|nr:MAG: hypothetical protein KatS3mg105_3569 [Gemmatales bacterium]